MTVAVIVVGGDPPHPGVVALLPAERFVIAADSGYDHCERLEVAVDLVVGDLDSISPAGREAVEAGRVAVEAFPADKDATDTELALDIALRRDPAAIVGVAGGGDRLDHAMATLAAFTAPRLSGRPVTLWWGANRLTPMYPGTTHRFADPAGTTFSLLAMHGPARVASMVGPRYPLGDAVLPAGSSLGISNVAGDHGTTITIADGIVAHIVPDALALETAPPRSDHGGGA